MFTINDDMSIYLTRGDVALFAVTAEDNGQKYIFKTGDIVRFKVTEKKSCESVVLEKDFPVTAQTETVRIYLTEEETKFGDVISKPTDFWYEVELNPFTNPQTILGYDEDGAKILKLFPEGGDIETAEEEEITEEDIPVVDEELDPTSDRPVQNQVIARAITELQSDLTLTLARFQNMATLKAGSTSADAELLDIRVGLKGETYSSAGNAVRTQIGNLIGKVEELKADLVTPVENAEKSAEKAKESEEVCIQKAEEAKFSADLAERSENTAKESELACLGALEEVRQRTVKSEFKVDFSTGHIFYDAPAYEFNFNSKGHLEWGVR